MSNGSPPAGQLGWKALIQLGERLISQPNVFAQREMIISTISKTMGCLVEFWFSETAYPLPGEPNDLWQSRPFSEFARKAHDTRQICVIPDNDDYLSIAIPLISQGTLLGVVQLDAVNNHPLPNSQIDQLEAMAGHISIALQTHRQIAIKNWRFEQLALVRSVSYQTANVFNLDELARRVTSLILNTFKYYYVAIYTLEEGDDYLRFRSSAKSVQDQLRLGENPTSFPVQLGQGIVGHVAQTGEELCACNVDDEPLYRFINTLPETKSEISLPLKIEHRVLGVLDVQSDQVDSFHDMDMLVLRVLADNIAIAIENAHHFTAAQEQAWVSTVLLQVAEATQSLSTVEEISSTVVRLTPMLVGIKECALFLWEAENEQFRLSDAYGFTPRPNLLLPGGIISQENHPIFQRLLDTRQPIYIDDNPIDTSDNPSPIPGKQYLLLPLSARANILGAFLISVDKEPQGNSHYSDERLAIIQGILQQTAVAVENIHLIESRQEEAYVTTVLLQVAQAVVSASNLDDVLESIINILPILVGIKFCTIYLWDDNRSSFCTSHLHDESARPGIMIPIRSYALGEFPLLDTIWTVDQPVLVPIDTQTVTSSAWSDLSIPSDLPDQKEILKKHCDLLMGFPLSVKGERLGILLAQDTGSYSSREKRFEIMSGVSQQVALSIQNDRLANERVNRERMDREIQLAREIQQSFLPDQIPKLVNWDMDVRWHTARQVGGDFYDFFKLSGHRLGLVIADVSDKGMPAALYMTVTRTLIRALIHEIESPAQVLERVNELMVKNSPNSMFVTAIYGILNLRNGELIYTNSGHNLPILFKNKTNTVEQLFKGGMAMGVLGKILFDDHRTTIEPGDILLFYTDGVTDTFSPEGEIYGEDRLIDIIKENGSCPAKVFLGFIDNKLDSYRQTDSITDDVTMMAIRRLK